jgi:hypothetical protein
MTSKTAAKTEKQERYDKQFAASMEKRKATRDIYESDSGAQYTWVSPDDVGFIYLQAEKETITDRNYKEVLWSFAAMVLLFFIYWPAAFFAPIAATFFWVDDFIKRTKDFREIIGFKSKAEFETKQRHWLKQKLYNGIYKALKIFLVLVVPAFMSYTRMPDIVAVVATMCIYWIVVAQIASVALAWNREASRYRTEIYKKYGSFPLETEADFEERMIEAGYTKKVVDNKAYDLSIAVLKA